ncbi:hypothetical protein KEM48_012644 [Puccinia striiformis f. sp. tritici PST-130]|uniref:Uncharacterized protein n=1 Tax=Puccinia striiformis f. sp. tritici PST-78 TaxID=1165861 RepID=A0A0L0W532_9BASI|nr:hypothetical protein KEM48_012644 [Puccinia striiformis f. sp. tritici PST-130]KNF06390.1 hypothetical protein PSTG_00273 [Puccinia striiformis f. sp. tritici PST-78]
MKEEVSIIHANLLISDRVMTGFRGEETGAQELINRSFVWDHRDVRHPPLSDNSTRHTTADSSTPKCPKHSHSTSYEQSQRPNHSPAISIAANESGDLLQNTSDNSITGDKSSNSNVVTGATPEITNTLNDDPNSINDLVSIEGLFEDNDRSQNLQADPRLVNHATRERPKSNTHTTSDNNPGSVVLVASLGDFNFETSEPMDPPPVTRFLSINDLLEFVQRWAKSHRYGKLENLVKRDSSTRKCECPFELRGSTSTAKNATDWYWYLAVLHAQHNHPASHCPSAHPCHWKLTKEQNKEVSRLSLTKSKVKASQILLQLHMSDSGILVVNQTITNAIHKHQLQE